MTRKTNDQTALEASIAQGIAMLHDAGKLAAQAGDAIHAANSARASALDMAIAGLCADGVMHKEFTFDVTDRAGNVVEHCRATLGDYVKGFKNADASDNRTKQSAFRSAMLPLFFGIAGDQSAGAKATWALFTGKALPAAIALRHAGVAASIADGKLVVTGGEGEDGEELVKAAAKSTSALVKAAKGEAGTNRESPSNAKGEGETREASPSEITRAALAIVKLVAKGDATACNATLENLRAIAKLVAANPEAFAGD